MLKILNLYAGIGGNRKRWSDVEVTAVEIDAKVADVYQRLYPNDTVIVGDAKAYLKKHFREFDFIWASPPCPTHGQFRQNMCVKRGQSKAEYPDMTLYEVIILLTHNFKEKFVVENVKPYYEYLVQPTTIIDRHPIWSNFPIEKFTTVPAGILRSTEQKEKFAQKYGFNLADLEGIDKRKALRNCVDPVVGEYIFQSALKVNRVGAIDCTASTGRYAQTSFINSLGEMQC